MGRDRAGCDRRLAHAGAASGGGVGRAGSGGGGIGRDDIDGSTRGRRRHEKVWPEQNSTGEQQGGKWRGMEKKNWGNKKRNGKKKWGKEEEPGRGWMR